MNYETEKLLDYCNDIAVLLKVDDKQVVEALSDFFDQEEFDELFESALKNV